MTARTKLSLQEAAQVRAYMIDSCQLAPAEELVVDAVDTLLALGFIDPDPVLKAIQEEKP